jgi:hypothetical protein
VAEQGCLLSSYPVKSGIGGSNPPLSATHLKPTGRIVSLRSTALNIGIPSKDRRCDDASSFDRREKQYSAVARWSIITATKRLCLHLE